MPYNVLTSKMALYSNDI